MLRKSGFRFESNCQVGRIVYTKLNPIVSSTSQNNALHRQQSKVSLVDVIVETEKILPETL
ncbi:hypothetical protein T01_11528 [Trichinella spiralis]|uniref:Uncharacterized protein n=1 Tax=Trichinella spiralis TaxID=6334 RepID=A0A0V1C1V6_TRISP|nr:hypothetical protein T01_11528 [Trichinella spiralis]